MRRAVIISVAALLTGSMAGILAGPATADATLEYGAYLAGECVACHQPGSAGAGIPALWELSSQAFSAALYAYRAKDRDHPGMQVIASRLSDADIAALAAYFSSLAEGATQGRDQQ